MTTSSSTTQQQPTTTTPVTSSSVVTRAQKRRRMQEQQKEKMKALEKLQEMVVVQIVEDLYAATIKAVDEFRNLPVRGPVEEMVSYYMRTRRDMMPAFERLIAMAMINYLNDIFKETTREPDRNFMWIMARHMYATFQASLEKFPRTPLDDRQEKLVTLRGKSRASMYKFELLFAMTTLTHFSRAKIQVDRMQIPMLNMDDVPAIPSIDSLLGCFLNAIGYSYYDESSDDE